MPRPLPEARLVRETILELCRAKGGGKTLCPTDIAKALAREGEDWHPCLAPVRREAFALAKAGEIGVFRKGKPIDPGAAHGVIRLGLPVAAPAEAAEGDEAP
ncbi:hypothetical protein CKO38_08730 [Rhodospirillum rubrum]|uniref:DUF3253 domain-containing protein n=1 Tax=Rhodospirillum rubrum TaxID=1085 RepID=UPI001907FDEE|nr:DUF3253 domain-containing protein [Rhodospirillum rubrum]MBK1664581.1 hypothetical protein [Rhodospirillum rubrum]MBK1676752.1 hypothetical protein [Rhodospirillum rubrum]